MDSPILNSKSQSIADAGVLPQFFKAISQVTGIFRGFSGAFEGISIGPANCSPVGRPGKLLGSDLHIVRRIYHSLTAEGPQMVNSITPGIKLKKCRTPWVAPFPSCSGDDPYAISHPCIYYDLGQRKERR